MTLDSHEALQKELDELLTICQLKEWGNTERQRLKDFRTAIGAGVPEIALALDVTPATVRWWERQTGDQEERSAPPPIDKVRRFGDLILERKLRAMLQPGRGGAVVGAVLQQVRNLQYVMDRARESSRFWVFRFGCAFNSGIDDGVFKTTVDYWLQAKENAQLIFVYAEAGKDNPETEVYKAELSYRGFVKKCQQLSQSDREKLSQHWLGAAVNKSEASQLGLVDPWVSYAMAEYRRRCLCKDQAEPRCLD